MSTLNVTNIQHESGSGNNIVLDSDGNVEIAGEFESSGKIIGNRDSGTSDCFSAQLDGTANAIIRADGRIRIGGTVGSSPNIDLSPDGDIEASNRVSVGDYSAGSSTSTGGLISTDGNSSDFSLQQKDDQAASNTAFRVRQGDAVRASINYEGTIQSGGDAQTGNQGVKIISSTVYACNAAANAVWRGYQVGSGSVKSEILGDGNATFVSTRSANVFINLEHENPDCYTSTMVDGEEQKVYSGPVLDVRDELQALRARATQQDAVIAQLVTALRSQGVTIDTQES